MVAFKNNVACHARDVCGGGVGWGGGGGVGRDNYFARDPLQETREVKGMACYGVMCISGGFEAVSHMYRNVDRNSTNDGPKPRTKPKVSMRQTTQSKATANPAGYIYIYILCVCFRCHLYKPSTNMAAGSEMWYLSSTTFQAATSKNMWAIQHLSTFTN